MHETDPGTGYPELKYYRRVTVASLLLSLILVSLQIKFLVNSVTSSSSSHNSELKVGSLRTDRTASTVGCFQRRFKYFLNAAVRS